MSDISDLQSERSSCQLRSGGADFSFSSKREARRENMVGEKRASGGRLRAFVCAGEDEGSFGKGFVFLFF